MTTATSKPPFQLELVDPALKPPLKWAGGKSHLVPRLAALYAPHRHRRLVEPFAGGLAVSLGLRPDCALINDINPHTINFYQQLSDGLVIEMDMANDARCYYAARDRFNALMRQGEIFGREQAALFYYLNRTCYNGLCRFNSRGEFNVPFGQYKTIHYRGDFSAYRPVLSRGSLCWGDFERLKLEPEDWVYLDPPFDVEFTRYAKDDFTWDDQVRLARWAARHPGPIAASNQATERILHLYLSLGFQITVLSAPRRIACNGDRTPAAEILATRNL